MFLYKILEYPLFSQFSFFLFWLISLIAYSYYLDYKNIDKNIAFRLKLLFLFLSMVSFIRLYFNFLPFTPDSIYYLDQYYRLDFFGPGFYERFISLINILFGDNVNILILINILIYCLSIKELILLVPNYKNKNFTIFFIFAFFLPSVIWFVPNILRESLFIYSIVMVLKFSLKNTKKSDFIFMDLLKFISFSFLAFTLRPQILPILFIWSAFILSKKNKLFIIPFLGIGYFINQLDYVKSQIISKLSFHYLESFKTEGTDNLISNIAFDELLIPTTFYELIIYAPELFFRFLFAPYIWDLNNLKYTFAYIDALFVTILIFLIIYNILKKKIFNYDIIYFSLLFLIILSIFEIAFTGAVRHRFPFIITLLPLVVYKNNSKVL